MGIGYWFCVLCSVWVSVLFAVDLLYVLAVVYIFTGVRFFLGVYIWVCVTCIDSIIRKKTYFARGKKNKNTHRNV